MLITRQEILLQNQRDNMAFGDFSQAMRELLLSEMEAYRRQQLELLSTVECPPIIVNQAA